MKKLIKKSLNRFYGLKLRNKLLISYIIFFFVPLCVFSVFTFQSFSNILRNNIIFSMDKNYSQTYSFLTDKLDKIKNTSDLILSSDSINDIFTLKKDDNWQAQNYSLTHQSMTFLGSLEDADISRIVLFLYQNESDPNISYNYESIDSVQNSIWYKDFVQNDLYILWCPQSYLNHQDTMLKSANKSNYALIRKFNDPTNYSNTLGYFCLYFSTDPINSIINMANTVTGSVTYLQNSKGDLVYASNTKLYNQLNASFSKHTNEKKVSAQLKTCSLNGKNVLFAKKNFADTDWNLITIVPYDKVLSQVRDTQIKIAVITFLLSLLCLTIAWLISNSITKRIGHLQHEMQQVQQGNLNLLSNTPYTDEIGYLYESYNFMMREIERLMTEKYKDGIQVKAAELRVLQSQINPHFLYNTLDTINWLAQKNSIVEVQTAITSLATFYKLSLSGGNDEIPIEDELKQVSSYVQIQNIRFSNGIFLIFDMDEEIKKYLILKLILQPFVENAILHGIMNKPVKEGVIIIKANIDSGNIKITIQDDGIGIREDTLRCLNDDSFVGENGSGYGIQNVRKRLNLNYGSQYSVRFLSEPSKGTVVEFSIPAKYESTSSE